MPSTTVDADRELTARDRDRMVRRVLLVEGAANLGVLAVKLAVGLATGSAAVLSDAVHSLTDLANNVMAWFAMRLASTPPDRNHPYGHRKFEPLAVFVLATLLAVMAVEIVWRSIERGPQPIAQSGWGLASMLGVLAVNIAISLWESRWARRLDSDLLRADVRHTASDIAITLSVVAGWQLAARGYAWLDTVCAVGVAGLILTLAYGLFRRAIPVLVDEAATDPEEIAGVAAGVSGVRRTRRVRSLGAGSQARIELTVTVDPDLSTRASHEIANGVERALSRSFGIGDITVHIEPDA